jgi:hypothetical protein
MHGPVLALALFLWLLVSWANSPLLFMGALILVVPAIARGT